MKTTHREELFVKPDAFTEKMFDEESIFFDIETTGFSPTNSCVYLIGCSRRSANHIQIDQFFAENPSEEKLIINAFLEIVKQYKTIISFNGIGFDVPFLKAKCDQYGLEEHFIDFSYLDIFKSVSELKFLLKLGNYKQKTIEAFLKLPRDDMYSGGELINVYLDYVGEPTQERFDLLHLHNYEDVARMPDILPVLSYLEIFNGSYSIISTRIDAYHAYNGDVGDELIITMQNDYPTPRRVSHKTDDFSLMISPTRTSIRVPLYEGELKFFHSNYKDYYYLPTEDTAVHKSVSGFVGRTYREQARASNCYTKKDSRFLPQYKSVMEPEFRKEYKDKLTYFEVTEEFCSSDVLLRRYVEHILEHMITKKK